MKRKVVFLSFNTYGTWLRGDSRGWRPRSGSSVRSGRSGTPVPGLENADRQRLRFAPYYMGQQARAEVMAGLQRLCSRQGWRILAIAVLSSHVHILVSVPVDQDARQALSAAKAMGTRVLRDSGLVNRGRPVWAGRVDVRAIDGEEAICATTAYVLNSHHEAGELYPHSSDTAAR